MKDELIDCAILMIEENRSPAKTEPNTIKYIGMASKVYEANVIEAEVVFCDANNAARIPNTTKRIRVSIRYIVLC